MAPSDSTYTGLIPDGVLEVVSPYDLLRELDEKLAVFLTIGARVAIKVNPLPRAVTIHQAGQLPVEFLETDDLVIKDPLPGFRLRVSKHFE